MMREQIFTQNTKQTGKALHLLTGEELQAKDIDHLLQTTYELKQQRKNRSFNHPLKNRHIALIFDKPSLRTRFSFAVAIRELGGDAIESTAQTRKSETPEDQALVMSGYCDGIVVRTHEDSKLERMASVAHIPVINGLSDLHHPCQILADIFTLKEVFTELKGLKLAYIGDGNNILNSLLLLAPQMGIDIHYCCPTTRGPNAAILEKSLAKSSEKSGQIYSFSKPAEAVNGVHAVYTDVWASMGSEDKAADHLFHGFQVNETLMKNAKKEAVFMHCQPMQRGKEVSTSLPDQSCSVVFRQSENRLHIQKAILMHLLEK